MCGRRRALCSAIGYYHPLPSSSSPLHCGGTPLGGCFPWRDFLFILRVCRSHSVVCLPGALATLSINPNHSLTDLSHLPLLPKPQHRQPAPPPPPQTPPCLPTRSPRPSVSRPSTTVRLCAASLSLPRQPRPCLTQTPVHNTLINRQQEEQGPHPPGGLDPPNDARGAPRGRRGGVLPPPRCPVSRRVGEPRVADGD